MCNINDKMALFQRVYFSFFPTFELHNKRMESVKGIYEKLLVNEQKITQTTK